MNRRLLLPFLFFLSCISQHVVAQQATIKFSKNDIISDLDYLYQALEDAHINLYAYATKQHLDSVYRDVRDAIRKDSLDQREATNTFQHLVAAVNNGHTEVDFPISAYVNYAYNGGTLFPLELAIENGHYFIRKNFSKANQIEIGSELVRINDEPIAQVIASIYQIISAERLYFKNAKVEVFSFPRLYWQVFGEQKQFNVAIRQNDSIKNYTFAAVPVIDGYEAKREEILNARMQLKFYTTAAYLNPGSFGGDIAKYQRFIDSAFAEINTRQTENLIIDLRNNSGGHDSFSDYLVAYIADKPFLWQSKFTIKSSSFLKAHVKAHNDTTDPYFKEILNHENGEIYTYPLPKYQPQPENKRYKGTVYVLINRQSHSQATVTAAQIQDYNWGIIVGEETGEYATLYASQFQFSLPHTDIAVKCSKGQIIRINGSTKPQGVIPDISINDHLLDEDDEILNGLLDRISKK